MTTPPNVRPRKEGGLVVPTEPSVSHEIGSLEEQYQRCVQTLIKTGIISPLPETGKMGVTGIDGQEYPVPTLEQAKELFDRNRELIARKSAQGFTRLQLTPFAMPLTILADRVRSVILRHYQEEKIFQAKRHPSDPEVPIDVSPNWTITTSDSGMLRGADAGEFVYFTKRYSKRQYYGLRKSELIRKPDICPIPGWSIELIEDFSILPQEGEGQTIGGRKQLETNHAPYDYLINTFRKAQYTQYIGETRWTPEDAFVDFVSRLEETNQVSYDLNDGSGLLLLGAFDIIEHSVPYVWWNRFLKGLHLDACPASIQSLSLGTRSAVRLV